jgi:uncharacterized protein (TIGR00730 family)
MPELKRVCVFCGSSAGTLPAFPAAAVSLGTRLAERHIELVYGGASVGLMGLIADAALAAGGQVTGVITESLSDHEIAHGGLARLDVVRTMHERKARMAELSDAFVMLPGGFATVEEFMKSVTWRQLAIHEKPSGIVNVDGYFAGLVAFMAHAVAMGFIRPHNAAQIAVSDDPGSLFDMLAANHALCERGRVSRTLQGRRGQGERQVRSYLIRTSSGATNRQRECSGPAPCASHDPTERITASGCGRSGGATTTGDRGEARR